MFTLPQIVQITSVHIAISRYLCASLFPECNCGRSQSHLDLGTNTDWKDQKVFYCVCLYGRRCFIQVYAWIKFKITLSLLMLQSPSFGFSILNGQNRFFWPFLIKTIFMGHLLNAISRIYSNLDSCCAVVDIKHKIQWLSANLNVL